VRQHLRRDVDELGRTLDHRPLRYGTVAINAWTGVGYLTARASWGAFPGHTPTDIHSGVGVGLRIDEALSRDVEHLGHQLGHRVLRISRKGGRDALEPLSPPVERTLDTYLADRTTGPLFLDDRGRRMYEAQAWRSPGPRPKQACAPSRRDDCIQAKARARRASWCRSDASIAGSSATTRAPVSGCMEGRSDRHPLWVMRGRFCGSRVRR
jgi:hypothetical protein